MSLFSYNRPHFFDIHPLLGGATQLTYKIHVSINSFGGATQLTYKIHVSINSYRNLLAPKKYVFNCVIPQSSNQDFAALTGPTLDSLAIIL
jgi:hypothetical protein